MSNLPIESLSDNELREILLTVDGRGQAIKTQALDVLIERATNPYFKFKKGDKVFITENAKCLLGLADGMEFKIYEILQKPKEHIDELFYPYALSCEELGDGWCEFFKEDELIPIQPS